jgi:hypothetical protein
VKNARTRNADDSFGGNGPSAAKKALINITILNRYLKRLRTDSQPFLFQNGNKGIIIIWI